jgi:hypothetical protein
MPGVLSAVAMAGRFPMSALWWQPVVAGSRGAVGVRWLWLPNFGNGGNDLPGHPDSIASVVPRDVVGDDPEERCQRVGVATNPRPEEI